MHRWAPGSVIRPPPRLGMEVRVRMRKNGMGGGRGGG